MIKISERKLIVRDSECKSVSIVFYIYCIKIENEIWCLKCMKKILVALHTVLSVVIVIWYGVIESIMLVKLNQGWD